MKRLVLFVAASLVGFGYQAAPAPGAAPFVLTWLEGKCLACAFADSLGSLQFTSSTEAWGTGDNWPPPGAQGTGEHIVVHTKDGGRTWAEIPYTHMHAVSPGVSFVDPAHGWMVWGTRFGDIRVQRTRDGGNSWQDLHETFDDPPDFLDEDHWYSASEGKFLRSDNAGKTWRETRIPHLGFVYRALFHSLDVGWIVSVDGNDFLIFRTVDGGNTWKESRTAAPGPGTYVKDLYFLDAMRGWLIAWRDSGHGSDLFSTVDGGETWMREPDPLLQGERKLAGVVRFLSEKTGFVFEDEQASSSDSRGAVAGGPRLSLVYTSDGGAHWREQILPRYVSDCQVFKGDLRCSAGDARSGFWVLTLRLR